MSFFFAFQAVLNLIAYFNSEQHHHQNLSQSENCSQPLGLTCDWYINCLEEKHSCKNTPYPYATDYAFKFCSSFQTNYNSYSKIGQQWIDATKKCLQLALAPEYNSNDSCQQIQEFAFSSHASCYVNPGENGPSFCSLPYLDWLRTANLIKSSFISVPIESLKGIFEVLKSCTFGTSVQLKTYQLKLSSSSLLESNVNLGEQLQKQMELSKNVQILISDLKNNNDQTILELLMFADNQNQHEIAQGIEKLTQEKAGDLLKIVYAVECTLNKC